MTATLPLPDLAAALFTTRLQPSQQLSAAEVRAAVDQTLTGCAGDCSGCVACVAAEYGEHPEAAAERMRWALAQVARAYRPVRLDVQDGAELLAGAVPQLPSADLGAATRAQALLDVARVANGHRSRACLARSLYVAAVGGWPRPTVRVYWQTAADAVTLLRAGEVRS